MEHYIEVLKQVAAIFAIVAPAIKMWFASRSPGPKQLEDRAAKLKLFFHEGGTEQPPILMEASFGSAVGHLHLTAVEIPLVLRQKTPTQFLQRYLSVRQYCSPTPDGSKFELKSFAAGPIVSTIALLFAFVCYMLFAMAAFWQIFVAIPEHISKSLWVTAGGAFFSAAIFAALAAYFLFEGRRVLWARRLLKGQYGNQKT